MADRKTAVEHWDVFLNRRPFVLDREEVGATLEGKRILITGAGGWIGSALTRALAGFAPRQLVLLEAAEGNLYEVDAVLRALPFPVEHTSLLGSVSHSSLLGEIFNRHRPHIVFHAAAFKHVPLMEQNPFSAIENNAIGTRLLADAAAQHGAEQLILLSTDKAVDPVSIMGASKRLAELALLAPRSASVHMKAVRLGNVLGSEGSIVPLFLKQMDAGLPVTITHPEVQRYFLTTEDAVTLLLLASSEKTAPGVLVPELGEPVAVETLARHLITNNHDSPSPIVFTQLRPGDKMCESLLSGAESFATSAESGRQLRAVKSPCPSASALEELWQQLQQACRTRSLEMLLAAVASGVPEYQPSALLQEVLVQNRRNAKEANWEMA